MGFRGDSANVGHTALRGEYGILPSQVGGIESRDTIFMARTASSRFCLLGPVIKLRIVRSFNRARLLPKKLTLDLSVTPCGSVVDSSLL